MGNAITLPLSSAVGAVVSEGKEREVHTPSAHEMYVETAKQTSADNAEVRAAREREHALTLRKRRERLSSFVQAMFPALVGFALFVLAWHFLAQVNSQIPSPAKVWAAAVKLFSDPFYSKGPNDQGIGWNILSSLQRVGIGFGLAAIVGIPLGFMIGRFTFLNRMTAPIIAILRPVSPLAWLPIGLLVFKAANPAAIWVIFICSIWPMIINTAVGVQRIPQDYLNVARVLNLSEWKIFTKILFPAVLPYIVAAEMLTGGVGIGFWLWDEWNNLVVEHIIVAIFVIGIVGLLLEQLLTRIASRFEFNEQK
jgi:nitrate/nitrite transport system permease protein